MLLQDNNVERAADWVFSHVGELDTMETQDVEQKPEYDDGPGSESLSLPPSVLTFDPALQSTSCWPSSATWAPPPCAATMSAI